jgi:hypothetical protein
MKQIDSMRAYESDRTIAKRADNVIRVAQDAFGPLDPDARAIRDAYNIEFAVCRTCGGRTIPAHRVYRGDFAYHDKCP